MKFDRTSPLVWAYFLVTAANIVIASVVAAVLRRPDGPRRGVLSGHLFNGNLRVFYDTVGANATDWVFRYIRVGYLASDWDGLAAALDTATRDPDDFAAAFGEQRRAVLDKTFGDTLDGRSGARYLEALDRIVDRARA